MIQRRYSPPRFYARCEIGFLLRTIVAVSAVVLNLGHAMAQSDVNATPRQSADQLLVEANRAMGEEAYEQASQLASQAAALAPDSVAVLQAAAELLYLSGNSKLSLPLFDRVVELAPRSAPQNWQRGIALCSCGDFERGAEQFKTHHEVNPDDVENSAWYFLCIAKTKDIDAARKTVIPSRGDGRQPMMSILEMLKGKLKPEEVLQAAKLNSKEGRSRQSAMFYADLYVGLYFDSLGDAEQARTYLQRSQSYGIDGYMVRTAQVYLDDRFPAHSDKAEVQPK